MKDGAAEGCSIEVAAVFGLTPGGGEVVAGVEIFVAEELEETAVKVLEPARVETLTTPPLKRPNSAGTLFASMVNSWMSSRMGRKRPVRARAGGRRCRRRDTRWCEGGRR